MDPLARARAKRLEGAIALTNFRSEISSAILLDAARAFVPLEPGRARDTLLDALEAVHYTGGVGRAAEYLDALQAVRDLPLSSDSQASIPELLLLGFAAHAKRRYPEAAVLFRRAIAAVHEAPDLRYFPPAYRAAWELLDHHEVMKLVRQWVHVAREQGALSSLATALAVLAFGEVVSGRLGTAEATVAEAQEFWAASGKRPTLVTVLAPMAWRGREEAVRATAGELRQGWRGFGLALSNIDLYLVWLELGLGNYDAALTVAMGLYVEDPLTVGTSAIPEMVEAAVRCGDRPAALAALDRLSSRALAGDAAWGLGLLARSRALLADDANAERYYREAIDHLEQGDTAVDLARAHLLYGEWLRRRRRRVDSRVQLRTAQDMFNAMGAGAFAGRARTELLATGGRARQRSDEARDELTPQEDRVARLAARGASNQEISAQMFISPATVAYHLRNVFRKLDVSNRAHIQRALAERDSTS
ncbi:MAG: helix-turn-helix transcriptional regulator [Solirubrobacterales bacterium]|nr:helix-turn-helix transcriptional regulator [Solirubrobacterales bacterium]